MFNEWMPSEYAMAVIFGIFMIGALMMLVSGIICKIRMKKGIDISKTVAGKVLGISLILLVIGFVYIVMFYALTDDSESIKRSAKVLIALTSIGAYRIANSQLKNKVIAILIAIVTALGVIIPPTAVLLWDQKVESQRYYENY